MAALLLSVTGAALFLKRTFEVELCNLAGQNPAVNNCVGGGRRRRKRGIEVPYNFSDRSSAGLYGLTRTVTEGNICRCLSIYHCT